MSESAAGLREIGQLAVPVRDVDGLLEERLVDTVEVSNLHSYRGGEELMSKESKEGRREVTIAGVVPILRVADFDASVAYYVKKLGFELDWSAGTFGSISRGKASMMLCEGSQGCPGTWIWLPVSDSDLLFDELQQRGARIRHPPANFPWGSRELHVFDLDGHVLRLASEAPAGAPLGVWLHEDGTRWQTQADGHWKRVE